MHSIAPKANFPVYVRTLFLLLLLLICSPCAIAEEEKDLQQLTVTGKGYLTLPDPKKEALRDAFRAAVEQAVGVQVKSESLVENMQLIKDKILVNSDGYVEKWKITREKKESDVFVVEVESWVRKGVLNKDLFLNGIDVNQVYDWIGKPRILVLMADYIDGTQALTSFAQTEVENLLISKGIKVLRDEQVKIIAQRDATLAFDNKDKAVALGQRFGAEIVIAGKCVSNFSRELDISGYKYVFYTSHMEIKIFRTSNGELMVSNMYMEVPGKNTSALGKNDAVLRSIQNITQANAKDIVYRLVKQWFEGASKAKIYHVIVSGVKNTEVVSLIKSLEDVPDMVQVFKRSFSRGVAEIEVEYNGLQEKLSEIIESNTTLPLALSQEEPYRISFERKKE
jgi:hypothetical protein